MWWIVYKWKENINTLNQCHEQTAAILEIVRKSVAEVSFLHTLWHYVKLEHYIT